MKVFLASDHAGFKLKEKIKSFLKRKKISYEDMGAYSYNKNDDYPDFIIKTAEKVAKTKSKGIIIGFSGQGEAIAANKVRHIRAVVCYVKNKKIIKLSREHNDANILSLGAGFLSEKEAFELIWLWLRTPFSREQRHKRRIKKITNYERKSM
ncbi:MAG: RpiB/LacA/LacB family sugar-phosphate isomerase [Candidatus Pacearchaeota archaeon]